VTQPVRDGGDRRPPSPGLVVVVVAVCLAAPLVALLWVGSYAKAEPRLWGFPFFYWYQLLWVFLAAGLTFGAYVLLERGRGGSGGGGVSGGGGPAGDGPATGAPDDSPKGEEVSA
jgi:hypothetical protein